MTAGPSTQLMVSVHLCVTKSTVRTVSGLHLTIDTSSTGELAVNGTEASTTDVFASNGEISDVFIAYCEVSCTSCRSCCCQTTFRC